MDDYSTERYRVYDVILQREFPWPLFSHILIADETIQGPSFDKYLLRSNDSVKVRIGDLRLLEMEWEKFSSEKFYNDYSIRNVKTYPLDADLLHPFRHIETVSMRDSNTASYFRHGPNTNAIVYWFSMPSFNKDYTECVVYYQYFCGSSCGEGVWCWLQKKGNDWEILRRYQVWYS